MSGTSESPVEVRREGAACVIALNSERKLNALSSRIEAAIDAALDHPDVRAGACVVFTGGPRAFSAGADVSELCDMDPAAILAYYRATGGVYERVAQLPQPTVSAIAGYCLGGGLELALATDFRIAETTATFGLPEVGRDLLPTWGGHHRLARVTGLGRAKELVLLGRRLDADGALTAGLVTEVVADGAARERALALAEAAVANAGRATLARAKALVTAGYSADARTAALLDVLAEAGQA